VPIRILIADDHPLFTEGLRILLEADDGFTIEGTAGNGDETIEMCLRLRPDVVLLDVAMPRLSGVQTLRRLNRECPDVRAIMLTANINRQQVVDAVRCGARGIVLKECASAVLCHAIREVAAGGYWIGGGEVGALVAAIRGRAAGPTPPTSLPLTPLDREIVAAVAEGATNDEISRQFGLQRQTVKNHLTLIYDKLGVTNRLELAMLALRSRSKDEAPE